VVLGNHDGVISDDDLLCELHAHSRWSDGDLELSELVDLYGQAGFDVLCVTDHVIAHDRDHVHAGNHAAYLEAIGAQAERAAARYGLLVLPGLELTEDHDDPRRAAHAVAVGLHRYVGLEHGLDEALREARAAGAALIAAHPYATGQQGRPARATERFSAEPAWTAKVVDRSELFNRWERFSAVGRVPVVANGDFHRPEHLSSWKTFLPCPKRERDIVAFLRSTRAARLAPVRRLPQDAMAMTGG
jgi:predicted metal-dependent phosphoesterase TrpH